MQAQADPISERTGLLVSQFNLAGILLESRRGELGCD